MCYSKCTVNERKIWLYGSAVLIASIALILALLWPSLANHILESQFILRKGSTTYNNWIETPIPMYLEVNFFNWTNPDKIHDEKIKPNFEELGPYMFQEKHKRVNLTWNNNGTVSFNQIKTWHFDQTLSNGTLDDIITTLNPISATVLAMVEDQGTIVKKFANYLLNNKGGSLTVTKTVREFLFEGYEDTLLKFLKKVNSPAIYIPFDRFGWFAERNTSSTYDGRFTMYTGENDMAQMGYVTAWNGVNQTNFFSGKCGRVYGTTGELWPPKMDPVSPKTLFIPDICRPITLIYNGRTERYGVECSQWIADDKFLDNGHLYEENRCFCPEKDFAKCPPSGVLDISTCRYGAPAFLSYPHFYMADSKFGDAVSGMHPNKTLHDFTLSLEPTTGIPLDVNARLQINIQLRRDNQFDIYKNVPNILMPVLWFDQKVSLDDEFAGKVKFALSLPELGLHIAYGLFGLAMLIILVGIILTVTNSWSRHTHEDEEYLND